MSATAEQLQQQHPEVIESLISVRDKPALRVRREGFRDVCQAAKQMGFDYLACITGVDRPQEQSIQVIYNLYSYERREHLLIVTSCPRSQATVPSVTDTWSAARFLERETYDLVGVWFQGHEDLKRILLPEGWTGHPLRKDYDMDREQFVHKDEQGADVVSFDRTRGW